MTEDSEVQRLARLFVDNFEVGNRKAESDIADAVCARFGIDLSSIEQHVRREHLGRARARERLRSQLAQLLSERAGSAAELLSVVARSGASFLQMIDEIYSFLSGFRSTTTGPSDEFRFRVDDMDLGISLSPAFLELVRKLQRSTIWTELGTINDNLLGAFLGVDGDFYGRWPLDLEPGRNPTDCRNLAREMTYLGWLRGELQARVRRDSRWAKPEESLRSVFRETQ